MSGMTKVNDDGVQSGGVASARCENAAIAIFSVTHSTGCPLLRLGSGSGRTAGGVERTGSRVNLDNPRDELLAQYRPKQPKFVH